jgi:hypothetical protein
MLDLSFQCASAMKTLSSSGFCLLMFLAGGSVAAASESRAFDRTLSVATPVALEISTGHGAIQVRQGHEDAVRIHAVLRPLYGRLDLGLAEESLRALEQNPPIEQTGGRVRIGYTQLQNLRNVSMSVEVEIPAASEVHAETSSGGIGIAGAFNLVVSRTESGHTEIHDVSGRVIAGSKSGGFLVREIGENVRIQTESGGVQVVGVGGELDLSSRSGRIEASDITGAVRATTHAASIHIDNANSSVTARNVSGSIDAFRVTGAVHAESKSGAINIAQAQAAPIRAVAESGAIQVDLVGQSGYTIDAQSHSGKVAGSVARSSGLADNAHRLRQLVAGGGPLVDLDTRSSRIEIN